MNRATNGDPQRAARRRLLRRASLYIVGFFFAAVAVAAAAGAIFAWLLQPTGLPFLPTWIVATVLIVMIPWVMIALRQRREDDGGGESRPSDPA